MKTTDLIPILLYQLKDGDKYGLELINACSECSDGKIVVKQPTLYSILKKLEKSKFISSYWQDSDIGGKRHYFKITENGLSQLETYPPLTDLVKMAVSTDIAEEPNDTEEKEEVTETKKDTSPSPFDNFSVKKSDSSNKSDINVFDKLFAPVSEKKDEKVTETTENSTNIDTKNILEEVENNDNIIEDVVTPSATVYEENKDSTSTDNKLNSIGTNEVQNNQVETKTDTFNVFDALDFANSEENEEKDETTPHLETNFELKNPFFKEVEDKSLEEKTSLEINTENSKLLTKDEQKDDFVASKTVSKFTEKNIAPTESVTKEVASLFTQDIRPIAPTKYEVEEELKYQDYVDIKNDKNVKKILKTSNRVLYKILTSAILSLIAILSCFFVVIKSGFTPIFTVFSIISSLYIVYYACNFIGKFKEHRYLIGEKFTYNFKKKFIFRICFYGVLLLFILIFNLVQKNSLLAFSNFANFLAPSIISTLLLTDYLLALIFYRKV